MGVEKRDDGEFWMNFRDFCRQFQEVTICTTGPDFDGDGVPDKGEQLRRESICHICRTSVVGNKMKEHFHV